MTRRTQLVSLVALLFVQFLVSAFNPTSASAATTVSVFAGTGVSGYSGDGGLATSATLNYPSGIFADAAGSVYFSDYNNRYIRKVDSSGVISSVSGNGGYPPYPCTATGPYPASSVSVYGVVPLSGSPAGDLYFNYCTWTSRLSSGTINRYAGTSTQGTPNSGDGPKFDVKVRPDALAYSEQENTLYFVQDQQIKKVTPAGNVETVAGAGVCSSYSADGDPLSSACLHPVGLAYWNGHLYFGDSYGGNRSVEIFRIDLWGGDGLLHRIGGSGSPCWCDNGSNGPAIDAGISSIAHLSVSARGEVFFGSSNYGLIRKIDSTGYMRDVVDLGFGSNFSTFDALDNMYISVSNKAKIMKVSGLYTTPSKKMMSLGDSVAAGEGLNYGWTYTPTSSGTDGSWSRPSTTEPTWEGFPQQCHKSVLSYVNIVGSMKNIEPKKFACSGASANNGILNHQVDGSNSTIQSAQLGSPSTDPPNSVYDGTADVVTLQVGANDVFFTAFVTECYKNYIGENCGSFENTFIFQRLLLNQATKLRETLEEINRRSTESGRSTPPNVYLLNYYNPFPAIYNLQCKDIGFANANNEAVALTPEEQDWIVARLGDLNRSISVIAAGYAFVYPIDLSAILNGPTPHTWCTPDPWVYGPSIAFLTAFGGGGDENSPAPFHPTARGQIAIATELARIMAVQGD